MENISVIITAISSFVVTAVLTILLIPMLKRLKFGQSIREDGPTWHKAKSGTPTMGGIAFIIGVTFAVIVGYFTMMSFNHEAMISTQEIVFMFAGLIMAILFGIIGYIDDYIKVVKKQNLGLSAKQKLILQILVTAIYLTIIYIYGDKTTTINFPFLGKLDLGYFYYPILGILIVGIVNSVNLTDGIDGLCTSVTFIVAVFFMIATSILRLSGANVLATALAASCIAFLIYNIHPAKVFMGDTGSLFFGGMVVALAFAINMEFILFFTGFIYCCETLSVILQVISFKTTKKRIFKMSPIHHHFEMSGWSENKIVTVFSFITALMSVISLFAVWKIK